MAKEPSSAGKKRFHNHVEKALAKGHPLLIYYKKLNGRTVKRKIEPRSWRGNTLVAYDHKRKAVRSFRMERVKHMEKAAFWSGFDKQASAFGHAAELAGLGVLAAPSVQHMRGKDMSEDNKARSEVAGLGILAAPSIHAAYQGAKGLLRKHAMSDEHKSRLKKGLGIAAGGTLALLAGAHMLGRHDGKRSSEAFNALTKKIHAGTATKAERGAHAQMMFKGK